MHVGAQIFLCLNEAERETDGRDVKRKRQRDTELTGREL